MVAARVEAEPAGAVKAVGVGRENQEELSGVDSGAAGMAGVDSEEQTVEAGSEED